MNKRLEFNPSVDALLKPIAFNMTRVYNTQQTNPFIGLQSDNEAVKELKTECCHLIYQDNQFKIAAETTPDGKFVCKACGREINTKFDKQHTVDVLTQALTVINQLLLFGALNGMRCDIISPLISIKKVMPHIIQRSSELNVIIKQSQSDMNAEMNIGSEYMHSNNSLYGMTSF